MATRSPESFEHNPRRRPIANYVRGLLRKIQPPVDPTEAEQQETRFSDEAYFDYATSMAQGANKTALQIIRAVADIPHAPNPRPLQPERTHDHGFPIVRWTTKLAFQPVPYDPKGQWTHSSRDLGQLWLTSRSGLVSPQAIPVRQLAIMTEAIVEPDDTVLPPQTFLKINPLECQLPGTTIQELDFTQNLTISLNEIGTPYVYHAVDDTMHPFELADIKANAGGLLKNVLQAAQSTVEDYRPPQQLG